MNIKTISKLCIAFGAVVMIMSLIMDVSVDRIVNLHKLSQQQNVLWIGGIIFIAGIILFATSWSRQPTANMKQEISKRNEQNEKIKNNLRQKSNELRHSFDKLRIKFIGYFVGREEGWGGIAIRILVGWALGYISSIYVFGLVNSLEFWFWMSYSSRFPIELAENFVILAFVIYALSSGKKIAVFKNMLIVSLAMFTFLLVDSIVIRESGVYNFSGLWDLGAACLIALTIIYLIQITTYLKQKKQQRSGSIAMEK